MIDGQAYKDACQCPRYHSQEVGEVEVVVVVVQVSGETVLDARPNEPAGQKRSSQELLDGPNTKFRAKKEQCLYLMPHKLAFILMKSL